MNADRVDKRQSKQKALAVAVASRLFHYKWIADSIGITEKTIHRWKNEDKDFDSQLNRARADFIAYNIRKARPEFLLKTADRKTFGGKDRVEVRLENNPVSEILKAAGLTGGTK